MPSNELSVQHKFPSVKDRTNPYPSPHKSQALRGFWCMSSVLDHLIPNDSPTLNHEMILNHIDDIFGQDMHAKWDLSLTNATLGVIESGSLAILKRTLK